MDESSKKNKVSNAPRLPTGIDGFDDITGGGLPLNRVSVFLGDTGTGKTVFTLQVLANNAGRWNHPGIFVSFEENSRDVLANASSFGWDLEALEQQKKLFFLDAHLSADIAHSGKFDLSGLLAALTAKTQEMGAKFIVFDSLEALLLLLDDPIAVRRECYRLRDWLRESDLTCMIAVRNQTARVLKTADANEQFSDVMRYMGDCVVILRHDVLDRISLRELRVMKYRGALFYENAFPMVIGAEGIEISSYVPSGAEMAATSRRVSSGIESLDGLLGGGYFSGTSILLTGAPGVGKTIFAAEFACAACSRGEHTVYVTVDQNVTAFVSQLTSVGIHLNRHIESGMLTIYPVSSTMQRAEEHMVRIKALMRRHQSRCLVIDPLSQPLQSVNTVTGLSVADQLVHHAAVMGITVVSTCLSREHDPFKEESLAHITPTADTWIHLSYWISAEKYKRALTVIKSRGTRHASNIHEFALSDAGVNLKEVDISTSHGLIERFRRERESEGDHTNDLSRTPRREDAQMAWLRRELNDLRVEVALLSARQNTLEGQWKSTAVGRGANQPSGKKH